MKNSSPPPTVGRQITNSLPTGHRQVANSRLEKKYFTQTYDKTTGKKKTKSFQNYRKRRTAYREYAKRNERVIAMDDNFTHSLTRSLAYSIHHSDVNFRSLIAPLISADFRSNCRKRGHFESPALMFFIWSPLIEH